MHLMIDLETLSLQPNAVVTQIGWATFMPDLQWTGALHSGCFACNPADQIHRGRHVEWSTLAFWMQQSDDARSKFVTQIATVPMVEVLNEFKMSFDWERIEGVWGNGAMFDLSVMEDLFFFYGIEIPWTYKKQRCFRTLKNLRASMEFTKPEIPHSAEHDAIAQALDVQRIMHSLLNETGA